MHGTVDGGAAYAGLRTEGLRRPWRLRGYDTLPVFETGLQCIYFFGRTTAIQQSQVAQTPIIPAEGFRWAPWRLGANVTRQSHPP